MLEQIDKITKEILSYLSLSSEDTESFRLRYLSKKGIISELFESFKTLSPDLKKEYGQKINELKQLALQKLKEFQAATENNGNNIDVSDLSIVSDSIE